MSESHLGGAYPEDANTIMVDVWGYLLVKYEIKSVLDVGCGFGFALKWFAENGLCNIKGIEGWDEAVQKTLVPGKIIKHDFTTGASPVAEPFDLAWSAEFLEHVDEKHIHNFMSSFKLARHVCVTHAEPGQAGYNHVNCLLPGTSVIASGLKNATRRGYCGESITIKTSSGNKLSVTPNHPILTACGWVAAKNLNVGDNVISRQRTNGVIGGMMPNKDQGPSPIEEVFASFQKQPESIITFVPTSSKDFHGDGIDGEVEIVRSDRHLLTKNHPSFIKPFGHFDFKNGNAVLSLMVGYGSSYPSSGIFLTVNQPVNNAAFSSNAKSVEVASAGYGTRYGKSTTFEMATKNANANAKLFSNLNQIQSRFPKLNRPVDVSCDPMKRFRAGSNPDTFGNQSRSDGAHIDSILRGKEIETFAGRVFKDKVVSVESGYFDGHVFNMCTASGWYFASNIITHNCQTTDYWVKVFRKYGFKYDAKETALLRRTDRWRACWGRRTLTMFHRI